MRYMPVNPHASRWFCKGTSFPLVWNALLVVFGPCLFAALTPEHANRLAVFYIQRLQLKPRGSPTLITRLGWIGLKAGKNFVLKIVMHGSVLSVCKVTKCKSEHLFQRRIGRHLEVNEADKCRPYILGRRL